MKLTSYQASGFRLLNGPNVGGLISYPVHAATTIVKGQALNDDTAGFAINTGTDFASIFLGIAAEPCDNPGAAGAKDILVIPPLPQYQWSVPVDGNAVITRTVVGLLIDLGADAGHVAINDNPTEGWAFKVEDFDASAEAIAAHAFGYAIGRILQIGTAA